MKLSAGAGKVSVQRIPHYKYYTVVYDKKLNKGGISVSDIVIGSVSTIGLLFGHNQQVFCDVFCYFDGPILNKSAQDFYWIFSSFKRKGWSEIKDRTLYVTADNESFTLSEGFHQDVFDAGIIKKNSDKNLQRQLTYFIDRSVLQKLAAAKSLVVKVDNQELTIKPEKQRIFSDVLTLSEIK